MTLDVTHHITDNIAINNISENDDGHNISAPNRIAGVIMMRKIWRIPSYSGVYSLGADFHKLQLEAIEKLKINLTLSYAKDINMILHTWNQVCSRVLIPKELPTVADLVIIEYN
ncbi:8389_t:CDS:2, partial [Rhizophagus irregularis]